VIEVAIGEYGTDILDRLAESTTKNTFINGEPRRHRGTVSGDQETSLQLENGNARYMPYEFDRIRVIAFVF